jgi:hypothetical protein
VRHSARIAATLQIVFAASAACGGGRSATTQASADDSGAPDAPFDALPTDDARTLTDAASRGDGTSPHDAATFDGPVIDAPPLPDCPCFAGDGLYCGAAISQYGGAHACSAPGLASHAGDVYRCTGGAWTVATSCGAAGCYVAANGPDDCHVAGATKNLFVVFHPSAATTDLAGLFQCLLGRTDFNDRARSYPNGYGLTWRGQTTAACAAGDYACGVAALTKAGFTVADHDVVELVQPGYCGGDNDARGDGVVVGNIRVRGANVGDCAGSPGAQERVAVHEAFECVGHWENADCCTGEVASGTCPDNGEAFCPDCPCSCGVYESNGSYGGYALDCGGGKTYTSQLVPKNASAEFDPNACSPFALFQ